MDLTGEGGNERKIPRLSLSPSSGGPEVPLPGLNRDPRSVSPMIVHNSPNTSIAREVHIHNEYLVYRNIKESTSQKLQNLKQSNFTVTRTVKEGCALLAQHGLMVIEGIQLSGKTTLGLQILANLAKESRRVPVMLDRPEDYIHIPPNEKCVFFVDDIFGRAGISADSVLKWEKVLRDLLEPTRKSYSPLIITSESSVLREAQNLKAADILFHPKTQIKLDSEKHRLRDYEKCKILSHLVQTRQLKLSESETLQLSKSISHPWFYGCCAYLTNHRMDKKTFTEFMMYPTQFHIVKMDLLAFREPLKFAALVLLMKIGSLPKTLSEIEKIPNIHDTLEEIQSSLNILQRIETYQILLSLSSISEYVKEDNGLYKFVHESVMDAVCVTFWKTGKEKVILWCPVRFFLENVVLQSSASKDKYLTITEEDFGHVKRRLLQRPSVKFFLHPLFSVDKFLDEIFPDLSKSISAEDLHHCLIESIRHGHRNLTKKLIKIVLQGDPEVRKQMIHQLFETACEYGDIVSFNAIRKVGVTPCDTCFEKACKLQKKQYIVGCILHGLSIDIETLSAGFLLSCIENLIRTNDKHNLDTILQQLPCRDDCDSLTMKVFKCVCLQGNQGIFEHLLEQDHITDAAPLMMSAIEGGNKNIVDTLMTMTNSNQIKENYGQYFRKSCTLKEKSIAESLADLDPGLLQRSLDDGTSPVHAAATLKDGDDPSVLSWLLEKGLSINTCNALGQTPLHIACRVGNKQTVQLLLDNSADATVQDQLGNTPLHSSLLGERPSLRILDMILKHGAGLTPKNHQDRTPLHAICTKKSQATSLVVDWILERQKVGIDAVDTEGKTPLHLLLESGAPSEAVEVLLDHKASVNVVTNDGRSPLHIAAKALQETTIQILLNKGSNPLTVNATGQTPLHITASLQNENCSLILLNHLNRRKMNIDTKDSDCRTVLHIVVENASNVSLLENLLETGVHVSPTDSMGLTPLHIACRRCNASDVEKVLLLLQKKADIDAEDVNRLTPLHLACMSAGPQKLTIIRMLTEHGADPSHRDSDGQTVLHKICSRCTCSDFEVAEFLLNFADPDPLDNKRETPLFKVARSDGDSAKQMMELLVHHGADCMCSNGFDVITDACVRYSRSRFNILLELVAHLACKADSRYDLDTIRRMMCKGGLCFSSDANGFNIVHNLCMVNEKHSHEIIDFFLSHGVDVRDRTRDDKTALHEACSNIGQYTLSIIEVLGRRGVDVRARDLLRETALHKVCRLSGEFVVPIIRQLKKMGVDPNIKNSDGDTALHIAIKSKVMETIKELIAIGADISVTNLDELSPADLTDSLSLHPSEFLDVYCTNAGHLDLRQIRFLISKGADISCKDRSGDTILHKLCAKTGESSHANISSLLQAGADVNILNSANLTPYDIASFSGHSEQTIKMIQNWGHVDDETEGPLPADNDNPAANFSTALVLADQTDNTSGAHPLQTLHDQLDDTKSRVKDSLSASAIRGNYHNLVGDLLVLGTSELFRGGVKSLINHDKKK